MWRLRCSGAQSPASVLQGACYRSYHLRPSRSSKICGISTGKTDLEREATEVEGFFASPPGVLKSYL